MLECSFQFSSDDSTTVARGKASDAEAYLGSWAASDASNTRRLPVIRGRNLITCVVYRHQRRLHTYLKVAVRVLARTLRRSISAL